MDDRARLSASSAGQGLWLTSATAGHPQPRILSRWSAAQAVRAAHRMTPMQNVVRAPSPPGFAPSGALPHHRGSRKSSVTGSFARAAIHKSFTRTTVAESAKLLTDAFVAIPIRHHVMSCVRLPHAAPARESAARGRQTSFARNASWGTKHATGLRLAVSDRT
jgi:hypothetical protein